MALGHLDAVRYFVLSAVCSLESNGCWGRMRTRGGSARSRRRESTRGDRIGELSLVMGDSGTGMEEEEACSMTGSVASILRAEVSKTRDALVGTAWELVKLVDAWLGPCYSNCPGRDQKSCSSSICPSSSLKSSAVGVLGYSPSSAAYSSSISSENTDSS